MSAVQALRVVFMGTPAIAVPTLEALLDVGHEVVGVVTQPDRPSGRGRAVALSPVKEAALRHGLRVLQPASLRKSEAVAELRALQPEAIVVFAFGQILRPAVLNLPRLGCLNVHPSLLPALRGASPINGAILEGLTETGVTIMLMDEGMDSGPILAQVAEPVRPDDDAESLGGRLSAIGARLLVTTLEKWAGGEITPRPQQHDRATFTRILRREDGLVDWSRTAVEIDRQVRAFRPWPGAYTYWNGKMLKLLATRPSPSSATGGRPGRVVGAQPPASGGPPSLLVETGEGVLAIERLQMEGRKTVTAGEFARGYPQCVGAVLGGV